MDICSPLASACTFCDSPLLWYVR